MNLTELFLIITFSNAIYFIIKDSTIIIKGNNLAIMYINHVIKGINLVIKVINITIKDIDHFMRFSPIVIYICVKPYNFN